MLAPWGFGIFHTDRVTALAAAVRVINRVHGFAAYRGTDSHVSGPSSFADPNVEMIDIGNLPYGCHTASEEPAHFSGRQPQNRVVALHGHHCRVITSALRYLPALSRKWLNVMDQRAGREKLQFGAVACFDLDFLGGTHYHIANLDLVRGQDVPFLAIHIVENGQKCRAVWVIFNRCHPRGDAIFLPAVVHGTNGFFVSPANMPNRDLALLVTTTALALRKAHALWRDRFARNSVVDEARHHLATGRSWFVMFEWHKIIRPIRRCRRSSLPWQP